MAQLKEIVIDCAHPAALARFWASALDAYDIRTYGDVEIARLAEQGLTPDSDPIVMLDGPGPTLCFQKTERTSRRGRSKLHFDIVGAARTKEVPRLIALGARIKEVRDAYTVMLDPEGNSFCVQEPRK